MSWYLGMFECSTGYDLSTSTFSPDGRVFQVEYAAKPTEKSGLALGIACKDGVVLAVEKLIISKLLAKDSNRRIHTSDYGVGVVMAGLAPDARQLSNKTREEAQKYRDFYGSAIPANVLVDRMANHVHSHTLYWYLRPYAVSALFAAFDEDGPHLYQIDPNGVSNRYFATAIGKNKSSAKAELEKLDFESITCREAVIILVKLLVKLHDDVKDKHMEVEVGWVCEESKKKFTLIPTDLRVEAIRAAEEAKRKEELDDDEDDNELDHLQL